MNVSVSTTDRLPALKVMLQNEKYCKMFAIAQKLTNIASYISTREFSYVVQCLEKVLKAWEQGQHVTVELNKNILHVKKVRGQSEAALQIGMCDQKL